MANLSELLGRTLVLVAHPDDETVGCGGLLQRIVEPVVVFATDGAPRDQYFWGKCGSRLRYQRVREEEARTALGTIGVSEVSFLGADPLVNGEGIADQDLHAHMSEAHRRIAAQIGRLRPDAIVTVAYEGGHPDHDCCSMIAAQVGLSFQIPVWEFPLYHRDSTSNMKYQRFIGSDREDEIVLELAPEELANKQTMLQAYASQHPFLFEFDLRSEIFRPQHTYDYSRPPHAGKLNYEAWGWPITGADVCAAYGSFARHFAVNR